MFDLQLDLHLIPLNGYLRKFLGSKSMNFMNVEAPQRIKFSYKNLLHKYLSYPDRSLQFKTAKITGG